MQGISTRVDRDQPVAVIRSLDLFGTVSADDRVAIVLNCNGDPLGLVQNSPAVISGRCSLHP
jgi:hypothetical protein